MKSYEFPVDPVRHLQPISRKLKHPGATALLGLGGYGWDEVADHYDLDAVSEQIWAARVEANPGFSGNLHQDYEAAYGGFWGGDDALVFRL
jgi:hypothetical protein